MNKGFEAIEAHHLFGVPYERIEVVVHPQSIVHSLIDLNDGATLAHLGHPDMRVPISYALHYPERADVDVPRLDLAAVGELTFEAPDLETFACLRLALRGRARRGGPRPASSTPPTRSRSPPSSTAGSPSRRSPRRSSVCWRRCRPRRSSHFEDLFAVDAEAAPAHRRAGRGVGAGMSWLLVFLGLCAADHAARGGPLLRRQGDGDAGRALLPLLRADDLVVQARRDRVRGQSDPARRLRENHRHEPGGGDASGGRAPRLLPPARLEADRRDRRRAGGEHRPRLS